MALQNCGHEQPAHVMTQPDDMPDCSQYPRGTSGVSFPYTDDTGKYIGQGQCGGRPEKVP